VFQRFNAHANGIMHLRVLATVYVSMLSRRVKLIPSVSGGQIGNVGLAVPTLGLALGLQVAIVYVFYRDLEEDKG
jgi:hypothetical protein